MHARISGSALDPSEKLKAMSINSLETQFIDVAKMKESAKKIHAALIILLYSILALNLIPTTMGQGPTSVSVSPSSIQVGAEGQALPRSFTINVSVTEVIDLFGWQIYLYYSPRLLTLTTATLPAGHVFDGQSTAELDQDIAGWTKTISNMTAIDFANITGTTWHSDVEGPTDPPPPRRIYDIVEWEDRDGSNGLTVGDVVFLDPNLPMQNTFYFIDGVRFDGSTIIMDISVSYLGWGSVLLPPASTFNGTGVLCQVSFDAIRPGIRSLSFSQPDHPYDTVLLNRDVEEMPIELASGTVEVQGIPAEKDPSSVTITLPSTVEVGSTVHIRGAINPLRVGVTVKIEYRPTGGTFTTLAEIVTDETSSYSYQWNPADAGNYEIRASWTGDPIYQGAESETKTITVTEEGEGPPTPLSEYLIYIIIIVVIVIVVVGIYFLRIRRK